MKTHRQFLTLIVLTFTLYSAAQTPVTIQPSALRHGPEKGSLLIIGGGLVTPEIWARFTDLAGGKENARIVVIPTAIGDSAATDTAGVGLVRRNTGIKNVVALHTNQLNIANSEKFVSVLRKATGVFFMGGRQWRIADAYLNTLTHQAFFDLLQRGGVIAGTSAGASIQGSFLWRGDTKGAHILVGDHTQGLGFLRNSVIDQHLLKRNRMFDLVTIIQNNPQLIGIGLDESTAVMVQKDTMEVLGKSYVAIYDWATIQGNGAKHVVGNEENFTASNGPFFFLHQGQRYDLGSRKPIQ